MQSAPDTDKSAKRGALSKTGIYRWGCPCCGPSDRQHHRQIHHTERSIRKVFGGVETTGMVLDEDGDIGNIDRQEGDTQ